MTGLTALIIAARPRSQALTIADCLDAAMVPEPSSVSIVETDEARDLWQVEAHYEITPEIALISKILEEYTVSESDISSHEVAACDWVRQSLTGLQPVRAGRFFVHGSHDRHLRPGGGVSVEIDAGLAFGTGHHGTTLGCLMALEDVVRKKPLDRVLDIGCGTGVLGLSAAKMLRLPVVMSDIDPEAVRVAKENAAKNGLVGLAKLVTATGAKHRDIIAGGPYDLIFANILARPLVGLANEIIPLLAADGRLILSGLMRHQEAWVNGRYRNQGLVLERRYQLENWSSLLMRKPGC